MGFVLIFIIVGKDPFIEQRVHKKNVVWTGLWNMKKYPELSFAIPSKKDIIVYQELLAQLLYETVLNFVVDLGNLLHALMGTG